MLLRLLYLFISTTQSFTHTYRSIILCWPIPFPYSPRSLYSSPETNGSFEFSIEQEELIKGQLSRKVLEKTAREYQLEWNKLWVPFIAELNSYGDSSDVLLRSAENDDVRVKVICLFIASRYNKGLRGTQVTGVLGAIRHIFVVAGVCTRFMDDDRVSASRKGCVLRAADLRKKCESQKEHSALPMPQEMLTTIREGLSWSTAGDLDKRAAYLGNALSFDMALRVGSYTKKEPRGEDHCIKSEDWCFVLLPEGVTNEDETRERIMLKVGDELKSIDGPYASKCERRWKSFRKIYRKEVTLGITTARRYGSLGTEVRSDAWWRFLHEKVSWQKRKFDQPLIAREGRDYGQESSGRIIRIKRTLQSPSREQKRRYISDGVMRCRTEGHPQ